MDCSPGSYPKMGLSEVFGTRFEKIRKYPLENIQRRGSYIVLSRKSVESSQDKEEARLGELVQMLYKLVRLSASKYKSCNRASSNHCGNNDC